VSSEAGLHVVRDLVEVSNAGAKAVGPDLSERLFASDQTDVELLLTTHTGLDPCAIAQLLPSVIEVYLMHLQRRVVLERLSAAGLRDVIYQESIEVTNAGYDIDLTAI
jgi:hypothetical protein